MIRLRNIPNRCDIAYFGGMVIPLSQHPDVAYPCICKKLLKDATRDEDEYESSISLPDWWDLV